MKCKQPVRRRVPTDGKAFNKGRSVRTTEDAVRRCCEHKQAAVYLQSDGTGRVWGGQVLHLGPTGPG